MPRDLLETEITTPVYPDAEEWRRVLWKAADYIEEHGWCQGVLYGANGGVCIAGALNETGAGNNSLSFPPLADFLRNQGVNLPYPIVGFNDAPGRTKEEVVSTLRKCALEG